jgi:hypothetical protein
MPKTDYYMHYIGAVALLGRLSDNRWVSADDRDCIKRAMDDCASLTGTMTVVSTGTGWSLEPVP